MPKEIKELIAKLKAEGMDQKSIAKEVAKKYAELKQEKSASEIVAEVVEEYQALKAIEEIDAKFAEKEKADESQKAASELDAKFADLKKDILSSIPNQEARKDSGYEFKSDFVKTAVEMKNDNSWRSTLKRMLIADRSGDVSTVKELAIKHLDASSLYSEDYKKAYAEKVMRGDALTHSLAVPDEFSDRVIVKMQRLSNIFENATKLNLSSDKLNLLSSGDVTFTEVADQSTALTESEPEFARNTLELVDVGALTYVHDNLIADSNVDIVSVLENAYARGGAKYLKRATTVGNIATTGDKVNGVYSITGVGSVAVLDASGGKISYDDILNLMGTVDEVFWDGAVFEMNLRELLMVKKAKDTQGRPIFVEATNGLGLGTILGYPVRLNNQMPNTLDSSTGARTGGSESTILFGNPTEVFIGIKGGMEFESSMHYKFANRQQTFRGYMRWDQDLVNADAYGRLTGIKRA